MIGTPSHLSSQIDGLSSPVNFTISMIGVEIVQQYGVNNGWSNSFWKSKAFENLQHFLRITLLTWF